MAITYSAALNAAYNTAIIKSQNLPSALICILNSSDYKCLEGRNNVFLIPSILFVHGSWPGT